MTFTDSAIFLLVVAVVSFLLVLLSEIADRAKRRPLRLRVAPTFQEWYHIHYSCKPILDPEKVKIVLECIAEGVGVMPTQLLPSDLLDRELYFDEEFWDYQFEYLDKLVEEITGHAIKIDQTWSTLDDVIRGTVAQMENAQIINNKGESS